MKYLSNSYISMGFSGRAPTFDVSFTVRPETALLILTRKK
jgi:hypothetical protein